MFSIFKESDFLWREWTASCGTLQDSDGERNDRWHSVWRETRNDWRRWDRLPTYCVNWGNTATPESQGSDETIFTQATLASGHPLSAVWPFPRCAGQGQHGEFCREAVVPARARATRLVTGSPGFVMALLESISYIQRLSSRRTSAERLGAQESGQTA